MSEPAWTQILYDSSGRRKERREERERERGRKIANKYAHKTGGEER